MAQSWIQITDRAFHATVFNRFKSFLYLTNQNTDSVFYPPELALRNISEKRDEKLTEFISVWRNGPPTYDWSRQSTAIARDGLALRYTDPTKKSVLVTKGVPVLYNYTFRLWSRDLDLLSAASDSYLKWIHDYPNMDIYWLNEFEMSMYMKFGDASDKTDYSIYEKGQHFVYEYPVTVEGWQLTTDDSTSEKTILAIFMSMYLRTGKEPFQTDIFVGGDKITDSAIIDSSGYSGYSGFSGYSGISWFSGVSGSGYSGQSFYSGYNPWIVTSGYSGYLAGPYSGYSLANIPFQW